MNLLPSVLALLFAGTAAAELPLSSPVLPAATLAAAERIAVAAAQSLAPAGARIEVVAGTLDARLKLAPCARIEPHAAAGSRPWGATRIGLRCVEGAAWDVYLPLTVKVWAPAPVARAALAAGAVVDAAQLDGASVDWAADPSPVQPRADLLQGRVLARAVAAGQPLRAADLRPRQWFAAGDTVHIVAVGNGYTVDAEGEALSNGVDGQPVRVRVEGGRIVSGRPVAERRVEVAL